MGWLRLVGSLKLQVSFENTGLFHRALLQKRPIILRSLLIVATPHMHFMWTVVWILARIYGHGQYGSARKCKCARFHNCMTLLIISFLYVYICMFTD